LRAVYRYRLCPSSTTVSLCGFCRWPACCPGSGLEEVFLPQGAYRAAGGVATIGVSNLLVCRPDLPRSMAEALTCLLVLRATALVPPNAVGTQFLDVGSLIGTGDIVLHPGAVAAYRSLHG
jgi:TRAP-type uncharacterized transport system substrate-binding protein